MLTMHVDYPAIKMNPNIPVVNVGSRNAPSYLPAEACKVAPGQEAKKKLSPNQTRAMIEFACRRPKANADSIVGDGKKVLVLSSANSTLVSALIIRKRCQRLISCSPNLA
jgi:eukaryotic translation initiation factor 2C